MTTATSQNGNGNGKEGEVEPSKTQDDVNEGSTTEIEDAPETEVETEAELTTKELTTEVEDGPETEVATQPIEVEEPEKTEQPAGNDARADGGGDDWSGQQIAAVARRAMAVLVVFGIIGYGLGAARGGRHTASAEFVYSLDESIPDSFLREDRRLLTQLVTFKSDAVLTPVAADFDLTVPALRAKIDVATQDLSEVIRLDVSDQDADRAVAINRAILDRYLQVITDAAPADDGQQLTAQRAQIAAQLAEADSSTQALVDAKAEDVVLELRQESIQRQVDLKNSQINLLQQNLDTATIQGIPAAQLEPLAQTLTTARAELVQLEADLIAVATLRAELITNTAAQPATAREIQRLEARLATVDAELAQRELGPLVASPIRELSEPVVQFRSQHLFGLQGMAIGLLLSLPLAAFMAYRARKSQLWFD